MVNRGLRLLFSCVLLATEVWSANVKQAYVLSKEDIQVLVDQHLRARRDVNPQSSDMLFMTWDETLASESLEISRQCTYEHSTLPSEKYSKVGENIFLSAGMEIDKSWFQGAVALWEDEKRNYIFSSDHCALYAQCGHYTQVVWAKSHKVGCGATACDEIIAGTKKFVDAALLFCRYSPAGNVKGAPPYETGETCFDCFPHEKCIFNACADPERDGITDYSSYLNKSVEAGELPPTGKSAGIKSSSLCGLIIPLFAFQYFGER